MANTPHPSQRLLPASRLQSPVYGAKYTPSRVDQGVDYASITGQIRAVGSGVIEWIKNLQGFRTTVVEKLTDSSGLPAGEVYYGLETGGGTPEVTPGEQVQQGQPIAPGLGTGSIEVGFWQGGAGGGGSTLAQATGGYTEGEVTTAGQEFASATSGKGGVIRPGGETAGGGSGSGSQVPNVLGSYVALRDMPRTAPPGGSPLSWWWQSFTGRWQEMVKGGGSTGAGSGSDTSGVSSKSWKVRAAAEDASSGDGWTELSTNGNAAAALGIKRTATGSGGWDFSSLGKMYPKGTQLRITDPTSGKSATLPLTDYGDGSSFAPAIGLTPAAQQAIGWSGGDVIISLIGNSPLSPAPGMGTPA